jgi:DNA-binding transcriptional ArsR family regulator
VNNSDILWKLCRVLANETRLAILRRLMSISELCVSDIAVLETLSEVVASQHLRMLHEYGFLQLKRNGKWVFYRATANPSLPLAAGLFPLLKNELVSGNKKQVADLIRLFTAFTHPRRIELISAIFAEKREFDELVSLCDISSMALRRHLKKLTARNFIIQENEAYQIVHSGNRLRTLLLKACRESAIYHTS